MKNFSLKALGAFIFAAGLVVAGVATPAFATATPLVTPVGTLPTFTAGQAAPAFSVTADPSGDTWGSSWSSFQILKSGNTNPWTVLTCGSSTNVPSAVTLPACGISVTATSGAFSGAPKIYVSSGTIYINNLGTATFTLAFDNTVFTVANSAGSYNLTAMNISGFPPVSGQMSFNVAGAPKTVTFMPNGGSGSPTTQTSGLATTLTPNSFTRSGYTFSGWNSAADGTGANTADGATFNFLSDRTLYAMWTANSSGGGSGSGSSSSSSGSDSLANTGINATSGFSLLAGGLSLALVGAEMFMISRRKAVKAQK